MTITKADVELELQTTLPNGYTESFIDELSTTAESMVKNDCNRTSFTGAAAYAYSRACLCWVINSLVSVSPSLMKGSITSIKENDAQITFGNGRGIGTYSVEYQNIIKKLSIKSSNTNYSFTNTSTFYTESD